MMCTCMHRCLHKHEHTHASNKQKLLLKWLGPISTISDWVSQRIYVSNTFPNDVEVVGLEDHIWKASVLYSIMFCVISHAGQMNLVLYDDKTRMWRNGLALSSVFYAQGSGSWGADLPLSKNNWIGSYSILEGNIVQWLCSQNTAFQERVGHMLSFWPLVVAATKCC